MPWKSDEDGKSLNSVSRIKIGTYELKARKDGDKREFGGKGWRLELQNTGHRTNIQIHRAARSMRIKGCILPVHFNTLQGDSIKKGDVRILNKSLELMDKIQVRLDSLAKSNKQKGDSSLTIAAVLPAKIVTNRSFAYV